LRSGPQRGKVQSLTFLEWKRRLAHKLKALGTWARTVTPIDRAKERVEKTRREWRRKAIAWATQQAAAQRRAATQEGEREEATGRRVSARLQENGRRQYNEKRPYHKRTEAEMRDAAKRAQRAVATKYSARIGIRLWWWMMEGDGADARGPMSVRHGRRATATTGREGIG